MARGVRYESVGSLHELVYLWSLPLQLLQDPGDQAL